MNKTQSWLNIITLSLLIGIGLISFTGCPAGSDSSSGGGSGGGSGGDSSQLAFFSGSANITVLHNVTSAPIVDALVQAAFIQDDEIKDTNSGRTNISGQVSLQYGIRGIWPRTVDITITHSDFTTISTTRSFNGEEDISATVYMSPR